MMKRITTFLLVCFITNSAKGQSVDSLIDFKKYNPGTSLRIESYIHDSTDCGEWGGHTETINIFNMDLNPDSLMIFYTRYPTRCVTKQPRPLPKNALIDYRGLLVAEKQEIIREYIKRLRNHIPSTGMYSNASNSYEVSFTKGHLTTSFKIHDKDNSFKEYEEFRNTLFRK